MTEALLLDTAEIDEHALAAFLLVLWLFLSILSPTGEGEAPFRFLELKFVDLLLSDSLLLYESAILVGERPLDDEDVLVEEDLDDWAEVFISSSRRFRSRSFLLGRDLDFFPEPELLSPPSLCLVGDLREGWFS